MVSAPDSLDFFQVPISEAATAYAFHHSLASTNSHIWPRTEEQLKKFAEEGELFGVRKSRTGELLALCYATLDENSKGYEIGGLTVAPSFQRLGIATVLVSFALAHVLVWDQPWTLGQRIIAHVHESNSNPRKLLEGMGFQKAGTVTAPDTAPATMKRNPEGKVVGDVYVFPHAASRGLSDWFNRFQELLSDEKTGAHIVDLQELRATLRAIADQFEKL